ncbi:MAG: hypothetical protein F6J97_23495, partial [Leptolyngbya sp. SIO4C1]|nr:hypothetical protein [Leptolyngbya sp. SIO4C1]
MYRPQSQNPLQFQMLTAIGTLVTRHPLFSLWAGSLALSATLTLSSEPLLYRIGENASYSLLAVGAVSALSERRHQAQLRTQQLDKAEMERTLQQAEQEREELSRRQRELDSVEAKLEAYQARLKTEADTYQGRIQLEAQRQAMAEAKKLVDEMQTRLDAAIADRAAMQVEYEQKAVKATKTALSAVEAKKAAISDAQQQYGKLGEAAQKAINTRDEVLTDERRKVNGVIERTAKEIERICVELAACKEMIARLQAPKQFKFASFEADIGNQIQAFLNRKRTRRNSSKSQFAI